MNGRALFPWLAASAALAAGCNAPATRLERSRTAIEAAAGSLERGQLAETAALCDLGLANAAERSSEGDLQRFAAAYLAARARARAAGEIANLVALTMYADVARSAASGARNADRADALPPSLERLEVDRALDYLDLAEIAAHSRLGFEASVARVLDREREPLAPERVQQRIARAGLDRELVPSLHLALFRYLRAKDEPAAFRFAALALDLAAGREDLLAAREQREIERWVEGGSAFEFRCPKCNLAVLPRLRACPNDQTPNVEFVARRK